MSEIRQVPTLSLRDYSDGDSMQKQGFIEDLYTGLVEYGFIILKDHGVNTNLLDDAYKYSEEFFSLEEEIKKSYISPQGKGQRGYTPFGQEHAKDAEVMDLKEFYHVGRQVEEGHAFKKYYPDNIWPTKELPSFQETFMTLYRQLENSGRMVLEALGTKLGVEKKYFEDMIEEGNSILRLLHYPPVPETVDVRCVRAAAHEDINLITILVAATQSGLELKDRDGKWLPVETEKNNLIVDAGDMLSRICNEVIPATTHRVVNPNDGSNESRYSMPFFMHPHPEAMLSCIDSCRGEKELYEPIGSHQFLMQRLEEIGLAKNT